MRPAYNVSMDSFIGKYVCYGNECGQFCWGHIKAECELNTVNGPMEAFILDQRMSGPYPGTPRIRRFKGDTILRKDQIDLEKDIFTDDVREFNTITDEELFLMVLDAPEDGLDKLRHRGMKNMLLGGSDRGGQSEIAADVLKKRIADREEIPAV